MADDIGGDLVGGKLRRYRYVPIISISLIQGACQVIRIFRIGPSKKRYRSCWPPYA